MVDVEGRFIALGILYFAIFRGQAIFGQAQVSQAKLGRVRDERRRGDGLGIYPLAMRKIQSKHFLPELLHCVSASYTFSRQHFLF
jgi:hypothetical protein